MKHIVRKISLAAAAFVALFLTFPALAQAVMDPSAPPVDLDSLIKNALLAVGDFRNGAVLLGLSIVANLLTNITKIPSIANAIPAQLRPIVALAVAILASTTGAAISHAPILPALMMGIAAGGGSIALHEAAQTLKDLWARLFSGAKTGGAPMAAVFAAIGFTAAGQLASCAQMSAYDTKLKAAIAASPDCSGVTVGSALDNIVALGIKLAPDLAAANVQKTLDDAIAESQTAPAKCIASIVEYMISQPTVATPALPNAQATAQALAMKGKPKVTEALAGLGAYQAHLVATGK